MRTKHKHENKINAVTAISIGVIVSVVILSVLVATVGLLVSQETVEEQTSQYFIPLIHIVAVCIGCYISSQSVEEKKSAIIFGTAATYYVLLITITALIFGSSFDGVLTGVVSVLAGAFIILLLSLRDQTIKNRKRLRIPNR